MTGIPGRFCRPGPELKCSSFPKFLVVLAFTAMGEKTGRPGPDARGETKRKRYNIVLDPDLRSESVKMAAKDRLSWSTWVEDLIRDALERRKRM